MGKKNQREEHEQRHASRKLRGRPIRRNSRLAQFLRKKKKGGTQNYQALVIEKKKKREKTKKEGMEKRERSCLVQRLIRRDAWVVKTSLGSKGISLRNKAVHEVAEEKGGGGGD